MKTKQLVNFTFQHGNHMKDTFDLPQGLRVKKIPTEENYFLDEFPSNIFPENSMLKHAGEHYGIRLSKDQVE